jgi:hypothetical protein
MNINFVIFHTASIGDYFFLAMIVLASIIQSIAQNKKKKALQQSAQNENMEIQTQSADIVEKKPEMKRSYDRPLDNIFDSIERMLIPEVEAATYTWSDDYSESVTENENIKETAEISTIKRENLIQTITDKEKETAPPESVNSNSVHYKSRIREGFSLKKAVIYSEILNRKYT